MNIDVVRIPRPEKVGAPLDPLYEAYADVALACEIEVFGNDDMVRGARAIQEGDVDRTYIRSERWLAFPSGERVRALGCAIANYSLTDNPRFVHVDIKVPPEERSQGVAQALFAVLEESVRESGRTTIAAWTDSPHYDGDDGLVPKSGVGRIDPHSHSARWLRSLGFELEQAGHHSVLELPPDGDPWWRDLAARLERDSERAGRDYELTCWRGPTPAELREEVALLRTRMSTAAPHAGLDFEERVWDSARVESEDRECERMGDIYLTTVVRHVPHGNLVGYSDVYWRRDRAVGVTQCETFVLPEHRGRRLGAILKAANAIALREVNPVAARIHTFNAGENRHMLSINGELGFAPRTVEAAWQLRLPSPG